MNEQETLHSQLSFILECDKMKNVLRQTMLADYSRRENDAEHSWHLALCAMVLQPYCTFPVNMEHVLAMAAVHDLVEVYAGDTFAYDVKGYEDKAEREENAARRLFGLLPQEQAETFYALWREFEDCETDDSRFTNAVDRFQPFLNNTATAGHTWRLHDVKRSQVMKRSALSMEVMPVLRPFIENQVDRAVEKGWLLPG